jgi:hypothetical protein
MHIVRLLEFRRFFAGVLCLAISGMLSGCGQLDWRAGPLLYDVRIAPDEITPNADGEQDITEIRYSLRRPAVVSIYFENELGDRYYFRQERRRPPGDYTVFWGGAVDMPHVVETSYGPQEILSFVLADGVYQWTIEAVEENGATQQATGSITLRDGDTEVPELHNFIVVPQIFRPNQDGLRDDWVSISYFLTKDVETVQVYLLDPDQPGVRFPISKDPGVVQLNERGFHAYRYEGGVDLNAEPPPDGAYSIVGEARDAAGNAVRVTRELTIEEGGKPRADIAQGEIDWQGEMNRVVSVALGDELCFRAIVANEGAVPIRTSGPWPGETYRFSENYNTLAQNNDDPSWGNQGGVWRFGINFETTGVDFPFRWAVGRHEDLERRVIDGEEQWYLLPGTAGEVSGCILIDETPPLGTTFWWGGLIHQHVAVTNNNVDQITVQVGVP